MVAIASTHVTCGGADDEPCMRRHASSNWGAQAQSVRPPTSIPRSQCTAAAAVCALLLAPSALAFSMPPGMLLRAGGKKQAVSSAAVLSSRHMQSLRSSNADTNSNRPIFFPETLPQAHHQMCALAKVAVECDEVDVESVVEPLEEKLAILEVDGCSTEAHEFGWAIRGLVDLSRLQRVDDQLKTRVNKARDGCAGIVMKHSTKLNVKEIGQVMRASKGHRELRGVHTAAAAAIEAIPQDGWDARGVATLMHAFSNGYEGSDAERFQAVQRLITAILGVPVTSFNAQDVSICLNTISNVWPDGGMEVREVFDHLSIAALEVPRNEFGSQVSS